MNPRTPRWMEGAGGRERVVGLFKKVRQPAYRVFFAVDVHGSDRCFKKFLSAASAYEADAILLGGDLAGKGMVPVVPDGSGRYSFSYRGSPETCGEDDLGEVFKNLNFDGFYPRMTDQDELERIQEDRQFADHLVEELIGEQAARWDQLASERLTDSVRCIVTPGNDDPRVIDAVFAGAAKVECPELRVVELGPFWLASYAHSNPTPWNTEREFPEDVLAEEIRALIDPVADGRPLVFNFHCPPYDTGLDRAAQLDDNLTPVTKSGQIVEIPVGSTAVREAIERYQPIAGLHGHIHEASGVTKLGQTPCFNPGSDYSAGMLKGLLLNFDEDGGVINHIFTCG